eukprot:5785197-Prymnesium_polylepis.1
MIHRPAGDEVRLSTFRGAWRTRYARLTERSEGSLRCSWLVVHVLGDNIADPRMRGCSKL